MGTLDTIVDKLGDVAVDLVADQVVKLVRRGVDALLGDAKDDSLAEAITRAGVEGMVVGARVALLERQAAEQLGARAAAVLGAIAAIDVDALFTPRPHGHAGAAEVEIREPNHEGPWRTLEEELAAAKAESKALDERRKADEE